MTRAPVILVDWTPELIIEVIRRWVDGESANEIGLTHHITRSAILGKLGRLRTEMTAEGKYVYPELQHRTPKPPKYREDAPKARHYAEAVASPRRAVVVLKHKDGPTPEKPSVWSPLPGQVPIPLVSRGNRCAWPMDDRIAGEYMCCGAPHEPGSPYCPTHRQMALTKRVEEMA